MWPVYFLMNKIFRLEDEEQHELYGSDEHGKLVTECLPLKLSSSSHLVLPNSHFVEVPHMNQMFSWDCGLACVLMALRAIGVHNCSLRDLAKLCCTTSVWTVDLAYLLQKFSVKFSYYTVTCGANPNYSVETFYKEQLPNDLERVDMLFQKAVEAGINIKCRSISGEEIAQWILSGKYVVIALVDQDKLGQSCPDDVIVSGFGGDDSGYTGHYVLICGYDSSSNEFEIRDPASSRKHIKISSKHLEEARKSFGTDEDLLLISIDGSKEERT